MLLKKYDKIALQTYKDYPANLASAKHRVGGV